jgi:hypothetical protein
LPLAAISTVNKEAKTERIMSVVALALVLSVGIAYTDSRDVPATPATPIAKIKQLRGLSHLAGLDDIHEMGGLDKVLAYL